MDACDSCRAHYTPLLEGLNRIRKHDSSKARIRKKQLKNNSALRSLGQNHKGRRRWLWTHAISSHGNYVGCRKCISALTKTDEKTLTKAKKAFKQCLEKNRAYPARAVLEDDELLYRLVCSDSDVPADWDRLSVRREWLRNLIEATQDKNTVVFLPKHTFFPPNHGNVIAKKPQKST